MKKIFFWLFIVAFLLTSTFIGMVFYGKYCIQRKHRLVKVQRFVGFKFYGDGQSFYFEPHTSVFMFSYKVSCQDYNNLKMSWSPITGINYLRESE